MFIWTVCKDCAAAPEIQCCKLFAPTVPQNGRGIELQRNISVPTHVVTLTQVVTSVYLGQTHLGTPFQISVGVRKFSLGSTRDDHFFGDVTCHQF